MKQSKNYVIWLMAAFLSVFMIGCSCDDDEWVDWERPKVNFVSPANLAVEVAINTVVTATLNEAMRPATITAATFTLEDGITPVLGAVNPVAVYWRLRV
ncbi:MAG: Ig-like domain-containing protein [Desulfatibacillum sp.]|nr:Ig-like domain-containing protein [Desulfatibacillum sp.]